MAWEKKEDGKLAGERARRLVFQGSVDNVDVAGECYLTSYRGFAYWVLSWMPYSGQDETDKVATEWAELRKGFSFLDSREGWAERVPKQVQVRGVTATAITLPNANQTVLFWQEKDGGIWVAIHGKVSLDEATKIAEGLK